jgi:4-diphosphocytidyl-2-C-methyl-D-erythritol kinase
MVPLGLADRLSVAVGPAGADSLHVEGWNEAPPGSPISPRSPKSPEDNLVLRAIDETRAVVRSGAAPPLAARLDKRIPIAAGLGGGSSDAAAAIDAALEAWSVELDPERRLEVAARLGSDVPFFLSGGPALVEGRGERVMALQGIRGDGPGVLLVTPAVAVRTADVFARLAAGGPAAPPAPGATRITSAHLAGELLGGLRAADLVARAGILSTANDLAAAAALVAPGLRELRWALARLLGRPVGLSGSGPTLWVLYPSPVTARDAAAAVDAAFAAGRLSAPGAGRPFVAATEIVSRAEGENQLS